MNKYTLIHIFVFSIPCSVCDGPGRDICGNCYPVGDARRIDDEKDKDSCVAVGESTGVSTWVVLVIVFSILAVVTLVVYAMMKQRQAQLKDDIDALLKQYLPMDGSLRIDIPSMHSLNIHS